MARIFISYRRDESEYQAHRLQSELAPYFDAPEEEIFIDIDNMPLGVDFVDHIAQKVAQAEVVLAIIGKGWLTAEDATTGVRRLDNPKDYVRVEIVTALEQGKPVVPILLDGVKMPAEDDLPDELKPLVQRAGVEVSLKSFSSDVSRLMKGLGFKLPVETKAAPQKEEPKPEVKKRKRVMNWFLAPVLTFCLALATEMTAQIATGQTWLLKFFQPPPAAADPGGVITIGSKTHYEANVLAEIMAQTIEDAVPGAVVEREFYIGESQYVWSDLQTGKIDLAPEYSGTILTLYLGLKPQSIRRDSYHTTRSLNSLLKDSANADQAGLEVMDSFGFSNNYVLLMRREAARSMGVETRRANLSAFSNSNLFSDKRFGSTYEVFFRPDGIDAIADFYHITFNKDKIFKYHSEKYPAINAAEVDVIDGYATDSEIANGDYVVIEDDLSFWPAYRALPVSRSSFLEARPQVKQALERLKGRFTEDEIRRLMNDLKAADVTPDDIKNEVGDTFETMVGAFLCAQDVKTNCG